MGGRSVTAELTVWDVGRIYGVPLPQLNRRGTCVFREHKRKQRHLSIFTSRSGDVLWKCHACDPPDNIGDAVGLFARLGGTDRTSAWKELRERGYNVPGLKDRPGSPRRSAPLRKKPVPVRGRGPTEVLPLDGEQWAAWAEQRTGAVERFAEQRALNAEALRKLDVVDFSTDCVGFGYRDPYEKVACRVKIRPLGRKTFWIEPRPVDGVNARALGPLYLAHALKRPMGVTTRAVITEGETDALSLATLDIDNVVSLPDGWESSGTADLEPISHGFGLWLVATDADEQGNQAYAKIAARGRRLGITTARVLWGKDGTTYKDANEALQAGFVRSDFVHDLENAAERAFGYRVTV